MRSALISHLADGRGCVEPLREGTQPSHATDLSERRPLPSLSYRRVEHAEILEGHQGGAGLASPFDDDALPGGGLIEEALATRHPDGSFWDYPLYSYHKPYGTAYALMALLRVELLYPWPESAMAAVRGKYADAE